MTNLEKVMQARFGHAKNIHQGCFFVPTRFFIDRLCRTV